MLIKSYVMISWCTCNFYKFQKCCLIASIEVVPIFFFYIIYLIFKKNFTGVQLLYSVVFLLYSKVTATF